MPTPLSGRPQVSSETQTQNFMKLIHLLILMPFFGLMVIFCIVVMPIIFISMLVTFLATSALDLSKNREASFWRNRALSLIKTMNLIRNVHFMYNQVFGKCGEKDTNLISEGGRKEGIMKIEVRFVSRGEGDLKSQHVKLLSDITQMKEKIDGLSSKSTHAEEREVELTGRIEDLMGKLEQLSSFWDGYKMGRKYAELSQSQSS
eukprot:TRINITY_DN1311_c0_g1_i7.p2 TRINITY_DN1311_c0_g1~~TRINITY_DN1311_c0_g1_i7.p2  ORF type:complete len:204 (-),score=25.64 TRINITY_DN1311_c0_g1_i7:287-898(-)